MAGEIQLNSVTLATESGGVVSLDADVGLPYASQSEVFGTHTTFSGSHSDTATTINLASVSGISAGDYVVGEGIAPGTTVSSVGASSVVISTGLDTDGVGIAGGEPISFYKANKVLSPGLVAGALCRAWVNFNGTGTVTIRASYNVSSVTDGGEGIYTVNFTTAMPDADYSCILTGGRSADNYNNGGDMSISGAASSLTTTSARINSFRQTSGSEAANDVPIVCLAIFR